MATHGKTIDDSMLSGARYRNTHQASVDAILVPLGIHRKIKSAGTDFINVDNWHIRKFADLFCEYMTEKSPTHLVKNDVFLLVDRANNTIIQDPYISIAETPDKLPPSIASALIGSAYHESWHTKYSHREAVCGTDMLDILKTRWDKANWGNLRSKLLIWMNLIEDVRIERLGCSDFVGAPKRMAAIQDFVIDRELEVQKTSPIDDFGVIMSVFRDIGKGYNTDAVKKNIERLKLSHPIAVGLVESGPLEQFLRKTQKLTEKDKLSCFPIAMDVLITLNNLSNNQKDAESAANKLSDGNGTCSGKEVQAVAEKIINSTDGKPQVVLDISGALLDALEKLENLNKAKKQIRDGPVNLFRPYSTYNDRVVNVSSGKHLNVAQLHSEVRRQTTYLSTRLRHLFRATELVDIEHGVKIGRYISDRMLAESVGLVRAGLSPERPFFVESEAPDLSASSVVLVDESSSMNCLMKQTCKIILCLTEALDTIGCKTATVGFMQREEYPDGNIPPAWEKSYHRLHAMTYHIFKNFDERFQYAKTRFSSLSAGGNTPLGDGIDFALNLLSTRNEGHRFIFVITDGEPDDIRPVRNRLDLAKSIGVKVVGVGLGGEAAYVQTCFPDNVWAADIESIPPLLVSKVTQIIERNENNRGRRIPQHESYL